RPPPIQSTRRLSSLHARARRRARSRRFRRAAAPERSTPAGRDEPATTIAREQHPVLVEPFAIPALAGHFLVRLVERLAVVREEAAPDLVPASAPDLQEPIGIGERLPRRRDDVGIAARKDLLGLPR